MIKIIIFILLSFISVNKVFSDQNSPKLEGLFEDLYNVDDITMQNKIVGEISAISFVFWPNLRAKLEGARGRASRPPRELKFFLVQYMTKCNGKMQRAN